MNIKISKYTFVIIYKMINDYIQYCKEANEGLDEPEDLTEYIKVKETLDKIWKNI